MSKAEEAKRIEEIKDGIRRFSDRHYLDKDFEEYALCFCDTLVSKCRVDISLGKMEVWATGIVYTIAEPNSLFDRENPCHVTPGVLCEFFSANKSSVYSKANLIKKICVLPIGAGGDASAEITDAFYKTPEGIVIPRIMLSDPEIVIEYADEEDSRKIEEALKERELRREGRESGEEGVSRGRATENRRRKAEEGMGESKRSVRRSLSECGGAVLLSAEAKSIVSAW